MKNKKMRIVFTGGGTGGHLYPIIAIARQLKTIPQDNGTVLEMMYIGPKEGEAEVFKKEGIKVKYIFAGKVRRYVSALTIFDIIKFPLGLLQSTWHLFTWMPDVIFSKGGYGSVPIAIVGWVFRIPILIHESDAIPGLANRLESKFAERIAVAFKDALSFFPEKKTAIIGHPFRPQLCHGDKDQARQFFNITSEKPVVLAMGGSQGAQKLNEIILVTLPKLKERYEIILICGQKNYQAIKDKESLSQGLKLYPFMSEEELTQAFAAADLIVSRAGAGSIFEIAACHKPSILIPLPTAAADHQRANAFAYAKTGSGTVIEQTNLTPNIFIQEINRLFDNPEFIPKMISATQSFAQPEAAQKIAEELIRMGK